MICLKYNSIDKMSVYENSMILYGGRGSFTELLGQNILPVLMESCHYTVTQNVSLSNAKNLVIS